MKITEIKTDKILSHTVINIADAVINPYRGCAFGCKYCYAASQKSVLKRKLPWGSFVDVKINAIELLKKELKEKKHIKTVLIGSTTEVYQPIEEKYKIMPQILNLLGEYNKKVIILTRSTLIERDIEILKKLSVRIYFTYTPSFFFKLFEKYSPSLEKRFLVIKKLRENSIEVIPYICPLFPKCFVLKEYFELFKDTVKELNFENLNLRILTISNQLEFIKDKLTSGLIIYENKNKYENYWNKISKRIKEMGKKYHIKTIFYKHNFDAFCNIDYRNYLKK